MTVNEKEENFYQMAIESATAQNVAIVKEYKEQQKHETEAFQAMVDETLKAREKYETEQLLREMNTTIAKKSLEIRHEYAELALTLKEELFDAVKDQVMEYCKTDDYHETLKQQILHALQRVPKEACIVTVVKRDLNFVNGLNLGANVTVKESSQDFWGGCKVEFIKKQMIINQTYEMKFTECKRNFKFHPKE